MTARSILLVEDELPIRTMVRYALELADFTVFEAENVRQAEKQIEQQLPDLILLDWMLSEIDGITFAKQLKQNVRTQNIPIIMLTAKAEERNKVIGLDAGADDYVTKPFSPRELIARVHAVLRRGPLMDPDGLLKSGELLVDTQSQRVSIANEFIKLGPLEYRLLCFFMLHMDRVYSRSELLSYVWGDHTYVDERTVDVHIRRLRKHLSKGGHDRFIQTVHGSGYRFSDKEYEPARAF